MKKPPRKIHIFGAVGSGKTTLGRRLSELYAIKHYELDNLVWKRTPKGDVRNHDETRDKRLKDIVNTPAWIIEGAQCDDWVVPCFESADLIIFLNPSKKVRTYRLLTRFLRQRCKIESSHYRPTWKILKQMDVFLKNNVLYLYQEQKHR